MASTIPRDDIQTIDMSEKPVSMATSTAAGADEDETKSFLNRHIWLPILASLVVFVLAVLLSYITCRIRKRRLRRNHHDYSSLDEDWTLTTKVELQRRRVKVAQRDTALLNCSFFLRSSGEYTLLDHLPELGSRDNKQWFLVRHKDSCMEYVLTIFPKISEMILPFTKATAKNINEFAQTLQHPYILPLREVAFQMDVEHIVTVFPYNRAGSLRDHIYTARCIDSCDVKYGDKGQPLELSTVKLYSKQILQALLFLKGKGLPFFGHLHSGNVIVVNNTCRLCGYDGTLLSTPPKLHQLLRRYAKSDMRHFDVMCFGHLLYEMLTGFQLDTAVPESRHYVLIQKAEVQQILQYIFISQANEYHSIKQISQHAFFRHVKLRELDTYTTKHNAESPPIKAMLRSIKKGSPTKKPKHSSRASVVNETQPRNRSPSQLSITSKSSISSSVASSSKTRQSAQHLDPLTPVLSESEKPTSPVHNLPTNISSTTTTNLARGNPESTSMTSHDQPEVTTTERTALLSDIKKGRTLRKIGTFSKTNPRI